MREERNMRKRKLQITVKNCASNTENKLSNCNDWWLWRVSLFNLAPDLLFRGKWSPNHLCCTADNNKRFLWNSILIPSILSGFHLYNINHDTASKSILSTNSLSDLQHTPLTLYSGHLELNLVGSSWEAVWYSTIDAINVLGHLRIDVESCSLSSGVDLDAHRSSSIAVGDEPGHSAGWACSEGLSSCSTGGDACTATIGSDTDVGLVWLDGMWESSGLLKMAVWKEG